ncbi:MAG: 4Fe-4S dicluster domain-containing protein [Spirochaetota bacterium]
MNYVSVAADVCKGCRVCVAACPHRCLAIGTDINQLGYQYAVFEGDSRCTGCGICFFTCPEPGAITVYTDEPGGEVV